MSAEGQHLNPRDQRILAMVADGWDSPDIGEALFLSERTVKYHRSRIYRMLGARNAAHAVHLAHQRGLLGSDFVDPEDVAVARVAKETGRRIALVPLGGDR